MKTLMDAIGRALSILNQEELSKEFFKIADALSKAKIRKVEAIREALSRSSHQHLETLPFNLQAFLPALTALYEVAAVVGGKKKSIEDFKVLIEIFREYGQVSTDEFCQALCPTKIGDRSVDHQIVDAYLDKLEKALGNEQNFPAVYEALTADKRIAQPEAVELASRFLAPVAKGTSRPKALRRVLYRHEKLLESRAASASIAARR